MGPRPCCWWCAQHACDLALCWLEGGPRSPFFSEVSQPRELPSLSNCALPLTGCVTLGRSPNRSPAKPTSPEKPFPPSPSSGRQLPALLQHSSLRGAPRPDGAGFGGQAFQVLEAEKLLSEPTVPGARAPCARPSSTLTHGPLAGHLPSLGSVPLSGRRGSTLS